MTLDQLGISEQDWNQTPASLWAGQAEIIGYPKREIDGHEQIQAV